MSESASSADGAVPTRGDSRGGWLAMVFIGAVIALVGGWMAAAGIALLSAVRWQYEGFPRDIDFPRDFDLSWLQPAAATVTGIGVGLCVVAMLLMVFGAQGWGKRTDLAVTPTGPYPAALIGRLESPSRALWLVKWLLLVPHAIVLGLLWIAYWAVSVVAWFAILFTARYPKSLFTFSVGVLRWSWRVGFYGYSALGTDAYPPFSLDPRPYPADLAVAYPERLSRGLVLVKSWLLAIPHLLIVAALTGAGTDGRSLSLLGLLVLIAAVALLFTGRYLPGVFDFVMGVDRWGFRTLVYVSLLRDDYPPFRLDQGPVEPGR